jgi:DNA-directed RNA polymerase sigma subunit (sigma70/sigma32)
MDTIFSNLTPAQLEYMRRTLDPLEFAIITRRYGLDGKTRQKFSDIAAEFGRSRENVRQIEATAIAKIQHPSVLHSLAPPTT